MLCTESLLESMFRHVTPYQGYMSVILDVLTRVPCGCELGELLVLDCLWLGLRGVVFVSWGPGSLSDIMLLIKLTYRCMNLNGRPGSVEAGRRFGGVTDGLSRASIDDIYRVDRILQCRGDYDSREVRSKTPTSAQPCLCKYRSGLVIDRQRETAIDRQPQAPIDPRAPLTYRVQMPKIDVARLNALRPQPKPSANPRST
ncbi:hypothetical protein F2Q69_00006488 [Brassica cretica]|uniref:Uncharacterized protein n=1 Tax=Brassica cretica TaxID=69181 RepID=A0A8S9PNQ2_BRACR|nr:hypothetical protein F2Q69_00006488 [Brassica cretica]